ncbi:DUF2945 domain-containing protein [Streptomyces sp. SBT349]|uniref:DUF2945 domain-containing protein n=1 Tax=Streptomyces sp. SBT349 TaxID=1580539 RepID=UPI00066BDC54|nr:DUF2945 domain-containing protein [Streptomyces sp. SBT349]
MNRKNRDGTDREFRRGDRVSWRSHGSEPVGTVRRKITERTEAAGRTVNASPDAPQYEVESEKSGGTAVHRPEALTPEAPNDHGS